MANDIKVSELALKAVANEQADGLEIASLEDLRLKREGDQGLGKVRATPAARRLAKQHHLILENIVGTGPKGRIQSEDVESQLKAPPKQQKSAESVMISTEMEEIPGNPENYLGGRKPKESLAKRVPGLAKIMSMVDDLDLMPRLDTRGPDGRVVPAELGSIKRFKEDEDTFTGDYGEYVRVLPKRMEEKVSESPWEREIPEMIPDAALDFVNVTEEAQDVKAADNNDSKENEITANEGVENTTEKAADSRTIKKIRRSGNRKITAQPMKTSNLEKTVITLTLEIDMTEVKALRKKLAKKVEDQSQCRCTFTDFLLMAVSRSLSKHPEINSSLINGEIIKHAYVNMGLAVGMDDDMIVPVIKNTQAMTFVEMVKNRRETLKSVKNKYFTEEDLKGSTFTVTNLGMVGILEFTAIINQPNSAILSVGEVVHRMRLYQGEPMMRSVMKISLNLDHRVADGIKGAKFLQDVKSDMENPSLLLL
ncbi:MAG: 2-oxo acid dehydrogenase subunit E2 [Acetobacterium sp.]